MATKKPLANYSGNKKEIGGGDYVAPASLGANSGGATKFLREDSTWQTVSGSGGTTIISGETTINFGAFPGKSDASVVITGQSAILTGSMLNAWIVPKDTADHSADEHMIETIKIFAGNIVAGVGFTIYAFDTNQIGEPELPKRLPRFSGTGQDSGGGKQDVQIQNIGGKFPRPYDLFTIAWSWY